MEILKRKNKVYDTKRFNTPEIRIYHKKGTFKKSPRYLLKCGCCGNKLEIHYDTETADLKYDSLEIGGVYGHIDDWREILLPLLTKRKK
jgi:transcription elongation factor Elf1